MKILRVDLQKVKDNIKNNIEGYPRVERGNISRPFSFCKQLWNILTPLWFSRNPLRELNRLNIFDDLHLNNTVPSENYNWNSSGLQLTPRKLVPTKTRFVWTIRFSNQLLAGRKFRWNMTANQKTANRKPQVLFLDQSEKKTRIWFLNLWSDKLMYHALSSIIKSILFCLLLRANILCSSIFYSSSIK